MIASINTTPRCFHNQNSFILTQSMFIHVLQENVRVIQIITRWFKLVSISNIDRSWRFFLKIFCRYVEEWLKCTSSKYIVLYDNGKYSVRTSDRVRKAVHTSAALLIFADCFPKLVNAMKNVETKTGNNRIYFSTTFFFIFPIIVTLFLPSTSVKGNPLHSTYFGLF